MIGSTKNISLIILFIIGVCQYAEGQSLVLDSTFTSVKITSQSYFYVDSTKDIDIKRIDRLDNNDWIRTPKSGLRKKNIRNGYWLKFNVICDNSGDYYLENTYVTIDKFYVYIKDENNIITQIGYSDFQKNNVKNKVQFRNPSFKFSLIAKQNYQIYIYGFDSGSTVNILQLKFWDSRSFFNYLNLDLLKQGTFFGLIFLLAILGLITFAYFRIRIYLFFTIHMVSLLFFYFFSTGVGLIYIWDNYLFLQNYGLLFTGIISIFYFGALVVDLLKVKERSGQYFKVFKFLNIYFLGYLFFLLIKNYLYDNVALIIYKIANISIVIFPIYILILCIHIYRLTKDKTALYLIIIFQITLFSYILFPLIPSGLVPRVLLDYYKWLFVVESTFLLILTIRSFYHDKLQNLEFQEQIISEKKINTLRFIEGEDKERKRLSRQLHDSISLQLAHLKIKTKDKETSKGIDLISAEIRQISHDLNPLTLSRHGLISAISEEVFKLEDTYPDLVFEFNYEVIKFSTANLIAQKMIFWTFLELLNNILKHANSTQIIIHLVTDNNYCVLTLQDDGVGYDLKTIGKKGIGLQNIEDRAKLLNGTFSIKQLDKGVSHIFSIPLS